MVREDPEDRHLLLAIPGSGDDLERGAWADFRRNRRPAPGLRIVESGIHRGPAWQGLDGSTVTAGDRLVGIVATRGAWRRYKAGETQFVADPDGTLSCRTKKGTGTVKKSLRKDAVAAAQVGAALSPREAAAALATACDRLQKKAAAAQAAGTSVLAEAMLRERVLIKMAARNRASSDGLPPGVSRLLTSTRTTATDLPDDESIGYR